ncbi:MAG: hypothetical protein UW99_C0028G0015, partial [Candidatus Collierbacteria bacterium GW2011_GWC2_45_15]
MMSIARAKGKQPFFLGGCSGDGLL